MEEEDLYRGYRVNKWAPSISHLMFPNDLFLFGTLDNQTMDTLQDVLQTYANWSGQQANLNKSSILFIKGVNKDRKGEVASILGVKQMQTDDKYLGFHLLKPSHRINSYDFLSDKFESKLSGWKRISLTHAGRTLLIKVVLGLIPPYFMSISILPKATIKKLAIIMCNFWWEHDYKSRNSILLTWISFLKKKEMVG
ncbi:uncharacterized protein LOC113273148 [Papaver somniferum]|uniref:uncharacterized protein LOC113273148 n=1 Tax=Papaver somniferum TaxID=3469 RepID=UPI000E6FF81E|nr:uncharacterized protein LOC113273148 [Papaver somniferum]